MAISYMEDRSPIVFGQKMYVRPLYAHFAPPPLFYTSILLIFNNLQANVRIRDFFMLIMHLAQEEESGLLSLRKDIETPNKHTKRME